jgi:NitT/TauT family transport system ATP-binding protein
MTPRAHSQLPSPVADRDAGCVVHARAVSIVYPPARRSEPGVLALDQLSLDVPRNAFVSLIGPSGCGKSTFLRAVGDLATRAIISGEIVVNGGCPAEARRRGEFAFVFQDPVLLPWRTVLANVALPLEVGCRNGQARRWARSPAELLELVALGGFEHALPRQLSGGMRQRVALARALTMNPSLLLMDEPFGALDQITRDRMNAELLNIWSATAASVIFVTHSIPEAVYLSDRIVVLSSRPGHVKAVVEVPLARPRLEAIKRSTGFLELENTVRDALGA